MTNRSAVFALTTPNLGDDLQALTIASFSSAVSALLHRESLWRRQVAEPLDLVMNYWFMSRGYWLAPHATIHPIFHGFCVGRDEVLRYAWPKYLKKHGPIGCRDTHTVDLLKERGIDAFWSGCITLFLGRHVAPVPAAERRGVYFVDVPKECEGTVVPREICERATRLSNYTPAEITNDPLARWARIARLCDVLRRAELVVTRRLHTALPCVGFGVPTVLVTSDQPKDARRFTGYERFIPMARHSGGRLLQAADWTTVSPATIPAEIEAAFARLRERLVARGGWVDPEPGASLAHEIRLSLDNPGLGERPGQVRFKLGPKTITRTPQIWTDRRIDLRMEGFAAFVRFDAEVTLVDNDGKRETSLGALSRLRAATTPLAPLAA